MAIKKRGMKSALPGKEGMTHDLFFNMFELVLAAIVIIALINFVTDAVSKSIFEKNYLARDLALLVNTIYSAPGELTYNYEQSLDNYQFEFDFRQNQVLVHEKEDKVEESPTSYIFAENKNIPFQYKTLSQENGKIGIIFYKLKDSVNVESSTRNNFIPGGSGRSGGGGALRDMPKDENK